eukprot:5878872-Amphidinium_carterae.2
MLRGPECKGWHICAARTLLPFDRTIGGVSARQARVGAGGRHSLRKPAGQQNPAKDWCSCWPISRGSGKTSQSAPSPDQKEYESASGPLSLYRDSKCMHTSVFLGPQFNLSRYLVNVLHRHDMSLWSCLTKSAARADATGTRMSSAYAKRCRRLRRGWPLCVCACVEQAAGLCESPFPSLCVQRTPGSLRIAC